MVSASLEESEEEEEEEEEGEEEEDRKEGKDEREEGDDVRLYDDDEEEEGDNGATGATVATAVLELFEYSTTTSEGEEVKDGVCEEEGERQQDEVLLLKEGCGVTGFDGEDDDEQDGKQLSFVGDSSDRVEELYDKLT
jgi:hypothetical protein